MNASLVVLFVVKIGADVRPGVLGGVLNVIAGLLELRRHILGKGAAAALVVGVHSGQIEGVHRVLVLPELNGLALGVQNLNVQAEGLELFNQNLEERAWILSSTRWWSLRK